MSKLIKKNIYFILIVLIAFLLRFYMLGSIPVGFSSDEASLGYNAYSILKTGKDEFGASYPLAFKAFGEYKAPLYVYLAVPSIALFGLSDFSVRLPSALFGFTTILLLYFLIKELTGREEMALTASFVLAVLPWHLQFTRIAYEGSITLFLLTAGTLFFISSFKRNKLIYLILSAIFFALTFYSHYAVRAFIPLYVFVLVIIYRKQLFKQKLYSIISFITGILILIPLIPFLFSEAGLSRANYVSFLTDKGLIFAINEKRAEHGWSNIYLPFPPVILHNKFTEYSRRFLDNYISHFDFSFLLTKGDEDKLFKTPFTGLIYFTLLPFLLFGFVKLFTLKSEAKYLILSWLLFSPIPSSFTRLSASANRAFIMVIPICITIGLGLAGFSQLINDQKRKIITYLLFLFFVVEIGFYLDSYYIHFYIKNAGDSRLGSKETVKLTQKLANNYNEVWISNDTGGYIHFLFHMKYSPFDYQKQARLGSLDEFGFGTVTGFGKYNFGRIPKYYDFSKNILFIAHSAEEPKDLKPIVKTLYPDGRDAFLIYDTKTVKEQCVTCDIRLKPIDVDEFDIPIKTE